MESAAGPLPPWDADYVAVLSSFEVPATYEEFVDEQIGMRSRMSVSREHVERAGTFRIEDRVIPTAQGREMTLHVISPNDVTVRGLIYWLHSGGMVTGAALAFDIEPVLDLAEMFSLVVVSADYALAPEHPAPAGVIDSFEGLKWVIGHQCELGCPRGAVFMHGMSGGGKAAAAAALQARRDGLEYLGLMLDGPSIDDRDSVSYQQHRNAEHSIRESSRLAAAVLRRWFIADASRGSSVGNPGSPHRHRSVRPASDVSRMWNERHVARRSDGFCRGDLAFGWNCRPTPMGWRTAWHGCDRPAGARVG